MLTGPGHFIDYLRVLMTISAGAVTLTATFLRDVFPQPVAGWFLILALGAFTLCIISVVWTYQSFLIGLAKRDDERMKPLDQAAAWHRAAIYSFTVAVLSLFAFVIFNLTARP